MATTVTATGMMIQADTLAEYNQALADVQAAGGVTNLVEDVAHLKFTFDYTHTS